MNNSQPSFRSSWQTGLGPGPDRRSSANSVRHRGLASIRPARCNSATLHFLLCRRNSASYRHPLRGLLFHQHSVASRHQPGQQFDTYSDGPRRLAGLHTDGRHFSFPGTFRRPELSSLQERAPHHHCFEFHDLLEPINSSRLITFLAESGFSPELANDSNHVAILLRQTNLCKSTLALIIIRRAVDWWYRLSSLSRSKNLNQPRG